MAGSEVADRTAGAVAPARVKKAGSATKPTGKARSKVSRTPDQVPLVDLISFKGRSAMITGAAAGIGQAIACRFAEAGADLHLVDRNGPGLRSLMEMIGGIPVNVYLHEVDLSAKPAVDALWQAVKGREPDVLVNNAGVYPFRDYLKTDEEFLDGVLDINLKSVFWMCQHMVSQRGKKGGSVVNLGTIEAILPFKSDLACYAVSKSGVIALTRTLARDYGRKGFRFNAVLPGGVMTPGTHDVAMEVLRGNVGLIGDSIRYSQRLSIPRMARPDDVARMVLVLASDLSCFVNGALIPVDGGFLSA